MVSRLLTYAACVRRAVNQLALEDRLPVGTPQSQEEAISRPGTESGQSRGKLLLRQYLQQSCSFVSETRCFNTFCTVATNALHGGLRGFQEPQGDAIRCRGLGFLKGLNSELARRPKMGARGDSRMRGRVDSHAASRVRGHSQC